MKKKKKVKKDHLPYDDWDIGAISKEQTRKLLQVKERLPDKIWLNGRYEVWIHENLNYGDNWPRMHWLAIKRRDKEPIRSWRDLQRIKNDLIGPEHEGVELFPAETRLVDTSNQYHMFVLVDRLMRFQFGYFNRLVADAHDDGSKQAEWEKKPDDAVSVADMARMADDEKTRLQARSKTRDIFAEALALRKLKAWTGMSGLGRESQNNTVVVAKSQKRAVEMMVELGDNVSLHYFRGYWSEGCAISHEDRVSVSREGVWVKDGVNYNDGPYREVKKKNYPQQKKEAAK